MCFIPRFKVKNLKMKAAGIWLIAFVLVYFFLVFY